MTGSESGGAIGTNPYVGPRPLEEGQKLWGRDQEINELYYLLSAERIVLLHSPSGAGKSSLIQSGLIPRLRGRFDVLRPTRVNQEPALSEGNGIAVNRYVLSAVQGLEEGIPPERRRPLKVLAGQRLAEYIEEKPKRPQAPENIAVLFDQFEEILTVDPLAAAVKQEFFDQLGELLHNPRVWALFVLREDYLAPLDPYVARVPTQFKNRFRIDLLGREAAQDVIGKTAREGGREFRTPAVERLVHDLATMKVQQPNGKFRDEMGDHVEPVQLQVVCHRMWDDLPANRSTIELKDVERFGKVTEALGDYYARSVKNISQGDPVREYATRKWCGEKLISDDGIRGQVCKGEFESGGLANDVIERLLDTHLIRAEKRAGATWYELAHDRLVQSVRSENIRWKDEFIFEVQRRASDASRQDRRPERHQDRKVNPYIGPRPFTASERCFGRDREVTDLYNLLITERIVLLHSSSGVGKTSLVVSGLMPLLQTSFDVWPPMRVNEKPAMREVDGTPANRYMLSVLECLDRGISAGMLAPTKGLGRQTLAEYAAQRLTEVERVMVIFDQFEEILIVDPLAVAAKREFFNQLGELLGNPRVWALFVLREEYLGPLTPYAQQVPTHLKTRYRIDIFDLEAAREVIARSALDGGREFTELALESLVDDLSGMKNQKLDGSFLHETVACVEPVQLQVVCRQLWADLPSDKSKIYPDDLKHFGGVTKSLGGYYARSVTIVADRDLIREKAIRGWFETKLISIETKTRTLVRREVGTSCGLDNDLIDRLLETHLIRASTRAGAIWYELAHDRLLLPVLDNNFAWWEAYLTPMQRRADLWGSQDRPDGMLFKGRALAKAQHWARKSELVLTKVEREFLVASQRARLMARYKFLFVMLLLWASIISSYYFLNQRNSAINAEAVARQSVELSLQSYRDLTSLVGKVVAADSSERAIKLFDDFQSKRKAFQIVIDKNLKEFSEAIQAMPAGDWSDANKKYLQQKSLQIVKAGYEHWISSLTPENENVWLLQRNLLIPSLCERAIEVTSALAESPDSSGERAKFERLYWSELYWAELDEKRAQNQEFSKLENAMITFRDLLDSNETQDKLGEHVVQAKKVKIACEKLIQGMR